MRRVFNYEQYLEYRKRTLDKLSGGTLKKGTNLLCIMPKIGDSHTERGSLISEERITRLFENNLNGVENIGDIMQLAYDYKLGKDEVHVFLTERNNDARGYYSHRFVIADDMTYEEFLGVQND